jgi:SAM-dependent methyltransferase
MPANPNCLLCDQPSGEPFLEFPNIPIHPNVLWDTAEAARAAPRGDLALALCRGCGLIWNARFNPAALSYGAEYENSLHFSGEFQQYVEALADRLTSRHGLAGGHIAEIGSGKGEFLALLCERAGCTGIGFDPSYSGEADHRTDGRLTFVRELFTEGADIGSADLVVCRHVVEHLEDPLELISAVRRTLGGRRAGIYVEVPAAEYLLREDAVWDLIYPHVTCLSAPALHHLLEAAGFQVRAHGFSFGGQYLWAEGRTTAGETVTPTARNGEIRGLVARFADRVAAKRAAWAYRLPELLTEGPVALWGAGAKGGTFVNVVEGGDRIEPVVDVNPRKHGRHISGTGQPIVAPHALVEYGVRGVLVMNPIYRQEISDHLATLGVDAQVLVA